MHDWPCSWLHAKFWAGQCRVTLSAHPLAKQSTCQNHEANTCSFLHTRYGKKLTITSAHDTHVHLCHGAQDCELISSVHPPHFTDVGPVCEIHRNSQNFSNRNLCTHSNLPTSREMGMKCMCVCGLAGPRPRARSPYSLVHVRLSICHNRQAVYLSQ